MKLYQHICEATFLSRPNRFIAECSVNGEIIRCHVKNTGRLRELLRIGARVWLEKAENPERKTPYDLVAVEKDGRVVNVDSQAPNLIFAEWAKSGSFVPSLRELKAEVTHGSSRYDFGAIIDEKPALIEIKGVTLMLDEITAGFPDAPTERGVRHIHGLMDAVNEGYKAYLCFVVQRSEAAFMKPNDLAQPEFRQALQNAATAGVSIMAVVCDVTPESSTAVRTIPVLLD